MGTGRWGVIADDVTGACDVAAELRAEGLEIAVVLGVPTEVDLPRDVDVVVVGLGTRTAPRERAVADSLATAEALAAAGYDRWYQKYCSTFDSTDEGMIGPVADALVVAAELDGSAGTPATPHADRTVYRGHLFVGDRLLSESSLAHHPLTPMTDPDLVRVLSRQTDHPVGSIDLRTVHAGPAAVAAELVAAPPHVLLDALDDDDLDVLAAALDPEEGDGPRRLAGGGAGLMTALGRRLRRGATSSGFAEAVPPGPGIVLVGSASDRTREQLDAVGGPTATISAEAAVADAAAEADRVLEAVAQQLGSGRLPVVSASHDRQAIAAAQTRFGTEVAATAVEDVLARVALGAVERLGVRRLLVAGGESSGAVTRGLGLRSLRLAERVDPGVAWGVGRSSADIPLAVLLKSGNFGGVDLFTRAWESAP
jgi:3-dehydrotetronate 4-kinase